MKHKILLMALCTFAISFSSRAAAPDIYYYQEQFNDITDIIQFGDAPKDSLEFDEIVESLKVLYTDLASDRNIKKKDELLQEIKAVCLFMGEISPDTKSYYLSIPEKKLALTVLGLTEDRYTDSSYFCLPIYRVKLWDGAYTSYMIDNKSDSSMVVYKINFVGQTKHTTLRGSVDAGVSKGASRSIFEVFGDVTDVHFTQERCEQEIQVMAYIQPEVIQPKVEVYPEPDYLSPQEKQAFKKKEKARLKKEKEKAKKKALKAKQRKKKVMAKQRAEARKNQLKERQEKVKAQKEKRDAARKQKK